MPTISNAARVAAIAATTGLIDAGAGAGKIRVYTASKPAGPDTAISGQTLLAEFTCQDPAFTAGATGVQNLDVTPAMTTTGLAAGTATWARVLDSNNVAVVDLTVGTSGSDINLNTTTVSVGLNLEITSGSLTQPA